MSKVETELNVKAETSFDKDCINSKHSTTLQDLTPVTWTLNDLNINNYTVSGSMFNDIGLPENDKKEVFKKFSKLSANKRERLINKIEDHLNLEELSPFRFSFNKVQTIEDEILKVVKLEELLRVHAQLLIEEQLK